MSKQPCPEKKYLVMFSKDFQLEKSLEDVDIVFAEIFTFAELRGYLDIFHLFRFDDIVDIDSSDQYTEIFEVRVAWSYLFKNLVICTDDAMIRFFKKHLGLSLEFPTISAHIFEPILEDLKFTYAGTFPHTYIDHRTQLVRESLVYTHLIKDLADIVIDYIPPVLCGACRIEACIYCRNATEKTNCDECKSRPCDICAECTNTHIHELVEYLQPDGFKGLQIDG